MRVDDETSCMEIRGFSQSEIPELSALVHDTVPQRRRFTCQSDKVCIPPNKSWKEIGFYILVGIFFFSIAALIIFIIIYYGKDEILSEKNVSSVNTRVNTRNNVEKLFKK